MISKKEMISSIRKYVTVRIIGEKEPIEGFCTEYDNAFDNEPDPESITIRDEFGHLIEIYRPEIESISIKEATE